MSLVCRVHGLTAALSRACPVLSSVLSGVLVVASLGFAPLVTAGSATATVDALHASLLDVMRNADSLGFEGRRERLAPIIERSYDLPFVTGLLLGAHWQKLDGAARERAASTVSRHTVATYAARFDGFSGERFETVSNEALANGRFHVRTRLVKSDGDSVQLDYVLHEENGQPRIINVIANGVSDLSLKRAEYAAVIKDDGFDALIDRLEQQIVELSTAGG